LRSSRGQIPKGSAPASLRLSRGQIPKGSAPVSLFRAVTLLCAAAALVPGLAGCGKPHGAARGPARPELAARPPALPAWSGYSFRPGEKDAVDGFLRSNGDLRIATDEDRHEAASEDVKKLYGVYHPYFLRGDVNDDGMLDFVLAFVRRDSDRDSPWFSVVVFAGKDTNGFAPGAFLERDVSLADGDLSIDRDAIVITPDLDDDENTRRYRWDPIKHAYVFVHDDSEEDERLPAAQT
jgi:hypothetical protein